MAILNHLGQSISYDCSGLIEALKEDIREHGAQLQVNVRTEFLRGVKIYKEYSISDHFNPGSEEIQTAAQLLKIYEEQNSIF